MDGDLMSVADSPRNNDGSRWSKITHPVFEMNYSRLNFLRSLSRTLTFLLALGKTIVTSAEPHTSPLLGLEDIAIKKTINYAIYIEEHPRKGSKIPLAIGSALASIPTSGNTSVFVGLSDRGPNITIDELAPEEPKQVVFSRPNFTPVMVPLAIHQLEFTTPSVTHHGASPLQRPWSAHIPIKDASGSPASGLPPSTEHERAVDSSLQDIKQATNAPLSIDPEAVTYDFTRDTLWIAEEYAPSILAISPASGRVMERRIPGQGLPKLLNKKVPNRGFEAITYTPNDSLVAILQSPLRDSFSQQAEGFVRMIILPANPASAAQQPRTLAITLPTDARPTTYKIGEVLALSDSTFLALEAYESNGDEKHYHIILLDSSHARDIDSEKFILNTREIPAPVTSRVLLDFKDLDWASGKIEGLAMINTKTLVISKDNDFGVNISKKAKGSKPPRKVTFKDVPTEFLIVELNQPLAAYIPTF